MSDTILKARLRHAVKTEAEWKSADPVLLKGEVAYSSDKRQAKTGDGTSKWSALSYDIAIPSGSYLPTGGGTMGGTATIAWADSGNWSNNNSGVTFPVKRGGLRWNGQSDYVELYSEETGNDNLDLVLKFGDDNSNGLSIRNKDGSEVSRLSSTGGFTGTTLWDKISGKPSTYAPSSHTHDDRYYTESEINAKLATKSDTSHTHNLSTMINTLSTGGSTPVDADYYVSQYAGGGTTTTSYHRRPMSALWTYIKSKLTTVATSGSYNDLSNKPTIGNGTVTIKQAGTTKGSFTMNQTGATTIELTDNNTTYSAGTGISLSGTTFSNSGVRSIATGGSNGTIAVNTNGTTANVAVKGLGSAAYTASTDYATASHTHSYLPLSGGTLTGAVNLANNTWNKIGDDACLGDHNITGSVGLKALSSTPKLTFISTSNETYANIGSSASGSLETTANSFKFGNVTLKYDSTNKCVNFVFS